MGGEAVSGGRQSERDGGQSWRSGRALLPMLCSSCMEIPSRLRGGGGRKPARQLWHQEAEAEAAATAMACYREEAACWI
uniref:Uncharacterized protein n=1 Tax=Oryza nivara TaxID=4536 RepID=A0A0E0ILI2_ORYNI